MANFVTRLSQASGQAAGAVNEAAPAPTAGRIGGGSSHLQRRIIAERLSDLPRGLAIGGQGEAGCLRSRAASRP